MAYYSDDELRDLGIGALGRNVKISKRASLYGCEQMSFGDNSRVDDFCVLSGRLSIGRFVHVAPHCLLAGGEPGIEMHDFSGLAYHSQVFTQSDDYSGATLTNPTVDRKYKNERKEKVIIGRHVIIGAGSIIFPGVHLAEGCSVGAMTLVNKSTEPWGIYLGNPARRIRNRKRDLLALEARFLAERDAQAR